jgi:hypothetical protein
VAYACNPSYLEGRDQEDRGSKPGWANSSMRPCLKDTQHTTGLEEWFKVLALSSSPSTAKKKKVGLLGPMLGVFSVLVDSVKLFSKVCVPYCSHQQRRGIVVATHLCQHLGC